MEPELRLDLRVVAILCRVWTSGIEKTARWIHVGWSRQSFSVTLVPEAEW